MKPMNTLHRAIAELFNVKSGGAYSNTCDSRGRITEAKMGEYLARLRSNENPRGSNRLLNLGFRCSKMLKWPITAFVGMKLAKLTQQC